VTGEPYRRREVEGPGPLQTAVTDVDVRPEPSAAARMFAQLRAIAETLILTIVIFFVVQTFVAQPYVVEQVSMEQSLLPGQSVLVDKLTPRFDDYSRGDVVVFHPPEAEGGETPFIKRVIGLPGDLVQLRDGAVWVNGVQLDEPYIYDEEDQPVQTTPLDGTEEWRIEKDTLFVMGDHRGQSVDSRSFGPILRSEVIGRAVLRYWPLDKLSILQTPTYPNVPAAAPAS
jgi:signal peptidase I